MAVMTTAKKLMDQGTYLGYFEIKEFTNPRGKTYNRLEFTAELVRKDYIAMGDIVYGMYVNGILHKIGKAGGALGWSTRYNTYQKEPTIEPSSRRIIEKMDEMNYDTDSKIEVFAISVPKVQSSYFCPLTKETIDIEVSRNGEVETYLTQVTEAESEDLCFCYQKK